MKVTVYFNETRGSRFEQWMPEARMVKSELFDRGEIFLPVLNGHEGTLETMADAVWVLGNSPQRPNGRTERSISKGDVIVLHTDYGDVPMAVETFGFKMLDPFEWQSCLEASDVPRNRA